MQFSLKTIKTIRTRKEILEKKLKIKIEIKGHEIFLSGNEEDRYIAEKILEAIEKGFGPETALLLSDSEYILEEISIKRLTKKNTETVRGRIIGTKGRTLKLLEELSECYIILRDNTVYIIGASDKIRIIENAVKSLIRGAKQANVYKYLEKSRKRFFSEDLGLKTKGIYLAF